MELRAVVATGVVCLSLLLPAAASAQSAIAGVVRDPSGAVLPGVTVEAASPVLIEKVRTVVTDGEGAYRVIDLRPGSYAVTFSLGGFSTVKREGIDLPAAFTATVNVTLTVGSLEETITVSGSSPIVDTQNGICLPRCLKRSRRRGRRRVLPRSRPASSAPASTR